MQMMTPNHPRWEEFCNLLEGPEGCDFREDGDRGPTWHCNGGKDKTFAIKILKQMGFSEEEVEGSCKYFEKHGGYCDCEILFNVR